MAKENYPRKALYQDRGVAESYFDKRFSSGQGKKGNEATRRALARALDEIAGIHKILDLPCGTGRFTGVFTKRGYLYFGADVSMEMINVLARGASGDGWTPNLVRCDAEHLPFKEDAFDCVAAIRFLNFVPKGPREKVLAEMRRVSRRWLVVEANHLDSKKPLTRAKILWRKLWHMSMGHYRFEQVILDAGWIERRKIHVRYTGRSVGVYEKAAADAGHAAVVDR
jgi:ubiquinone/menaquinone biosynthesis C-methylase UbiE